MPPLASPHVDTVAPPSNGGGDGGGMSGLSITNKTDEDNETSLVLTIGEDYIAQW